MFETVIEKKIHVRVTEDLHRRLRIRCAERGVTIQDYVVEVLEHQLVPANKKKKQRSTSTRHRK